MNKKLVLAIEIVVSLAIVVSLYLVGVYVKPKEKIIHLEHPAIELRDRFLGVTSAVDKPALLWMVGKEGKILRSEDAGKVWHVQVSGTRENLQSIAAWDSKRAVVVGNAGTVLTTADGGATWHSASVPKSEVDNKLLRVRIDPQGTAWAVGVMGAVLTSSDYGNSWERKVPEQDVAWNDIAFPKAGEVWIVGEFGHAMHNAEPGSRPVAPKPAAPVSSPVIQVDNSSGPAEKVFIAPDGWVSVEMPTNRSLMTIQFKDAQHALIGGVEGTLLATANGGKNWNVVPLATKEHVLDLTFSANQWIGVGGRGLLILGDTDAKSWRVGRVNAEDYAWHAAVISLQDKLLFAGATLLGQSLKDIKVY